MKCISGVIDGGDSDSLKRVWEDIQRFERLKHPCVVQFFGVAPSQCTGGAGHGVEGEDKAANERDPSSSQSQPGSNVDTRIFSQQVNQEKRGVKEVSTAPMDISQATSLLVVTELMHGGSLLRSLDIVKRGCGRLHISTLLRIACMISGALRYLHQSGFTSGTIKSLNVLLSEPVNGETGKLPARARAKLADFGLSPSVLSQRNNLANTAGYVRECAELSGSAPYMSPEAWDGLNMEKPEMAMASDVYAFGILLYELLSLRRPWSKTSMPDIYNRVCMQGMRPEWPKEGDPDEWKGGNDNYDELRRLVETCWKGEWKERPSIMRIYEVLTGMQAEVERKRREQKKEAQREGRPLSPGESPGIIIAGIGQKLSKRSMESTVEEVPLDDVMSSEQNGNTDSKLEAEAELTYPTAPKFPSPPPLNKVASGVKPLERRLVYEDDKQDDSDDEVDTVKSRGSSFASSDSKEYYSAAVSLYRKPTNRSDEGSTTGSVSGPPSQATFDTSAALSNKEIEEELSTWVNAELNSIDQGSFISSKQRRRTSSSRAVNETGEDYESRGTPTSHGSRKSRGSELEAERRGHRRRPKGAQHNSVLDANQELRKRSSRLDNAVLEASAEAETWEDHVEAIERAVEKKDHSLILSILRMHGKNRHVARAAMVSLEKVLKSDSREFDFCEENGLELLLAAASRFATRDEELATSFCECVNILASPYDPRICHIMRAVGVSAELLACIDKQSDCPKVLTAACSALATICGGANLARQAIASLGGSIKIHRVLSLNLTRWEDIELTRAALKFCLRFAWQSSVNAEELMNLSIVDAVNRISQVFTTDTALDEDVIAVLEALANFPRGKTVICESGGFNSIASILARVGRNYRLAEQCCILIVSIAEWRDKTCGDAILRSSVVEGVVTVTRMATQLSDASGGRLGFHAAQALLYIICYGEAARTRVRTSSGLIVLLNLLRSKKLNEYCCGRTVAAITALMLDAEAQKELVLNDGIALLTEVQAEYPKKEISEVCRKALKRLKPHVDKLKSEQRQRTRSKFWWKLHRKNGRR